MIFEIFFRKNLEKKNAVYDQSTANFRKLYSQDILFFKTPFFLRKLAKIAEKC
jgi:hypothetical protein